MIKLIAYKWSDHLHSTIIQVVEQIHSGGEIHSSELLEFALGELSRGGGGGGEFGHAQLHTFLVEEDGSSDTKTSTSKTHDDESVPHERSQNGSGDHQDLVDEVALDDEQSADDATGGHPEGVRNGRLLLVDVPVDGVDSGEDSTDVDSKPVLEGVVEGVVEAGVQHVVDGG